jgi:hypothetical protein
MMLPGQSWTTGAKPFDPAEIVADIDPRRLPPEDMGLSPSPSTR